jgi:hypothetical protein
MGEGYIMQKMDEIWLSGVKITPYDTDVWVMCMYCMGTGDNDRHLMENFKYLDLGSKIVGSDGTNAQKQYSIIEWKQKMESGEWRDWFNNGHRMEQYNWRLDFFKMKEFGKVILVCEEKP